MQRLEESDLVKLVRDSEGIKVKVKVANCPLPIDETEMLMFFHSIAAKVVEQRPEAVKVHVYLPDDNNSTSGTQPSMSEIMRIVKTVTEIWPTDLAITAVAIHNCSTMLRSLWTCLAPTILERRIINLVHFV